MLQRIRKFLWSDRRWSGFIGLCFILLAPFILLSPHGSKSLEGWGSDQISHIATVPLFLKYGFRIYSEPSGTLEPNPGRIQTNWRELPRPYPPLNLIYHAPEAAAVALGVSDSAVIALVMLKYLFVALLLFRFYFWFIERLEFPRIVAFPIALVFFTENVKWAMNGFYDGIALAALLACFYFGFHRRQAAWGFFYFALAAGLHFRTLWYLPVGVYFAVKTVVEIIRLNSIQRRQNILLLGVGSVVGVSSAYALYLGLPSLVNYPISNVFFHAFTHFVSTFIGAAFLVVCLGLLLIAEKSWVSLATSLWMLFFLTLIRQNMVWHSLFLFPLTALVIVEHSGKLHRLRFIGAFGIYLYLATNILYTAMPLNFDFFRQLWLDGIRLQF